MQDPVERFLAMLERGEPLYGLGVGCEEWHADKKTDGGRGGHLAARAADEQGRLFEFLYYVVPETQPLKIRISGRGSHSYVPGREPPAKEPGSVVLGSATYCTATLELRSHPRDRDAVLVGDDVWYLTRAACEHSRPRFAVAKTCSDHRPRS